MNVLFWTSNFPPSIGGVQTVAAELLPALRARGHKLTVITTHVNYTLPDETTFEGIPVHRLHFLAALNTWDGRSVLQVGRRAASLVRRIAPDVLHLFGIGAADVFFIMARKSFPAPTLVTLQNENSKLLRAHKHPSHLSSVLAYADRVTTVARVEVERLVQLEPRLEGRVSYVYNTLKPPAVEPAPLPAAPRLLALGRLVPQKSFEVALCAFARVAPTYPDARLIVAGDGPERTKLENLAAELGIEDSIEFRGWVQPEEVPALINQVTAVVLPSQLEGLPLVGIETAQLRRALLATRVGGLPELVLDGETGFLSEPGDVVALAAAMDVVLANPERARAVGLAAQQHALEVFSFDGMVDAYDQLYRELGTRA
jgi:glycogen(starch) synthase